MEPINRTPPGGGSGVRSFGEGAKPDAKEVYPCHKCGSAIPGTLYVFQLPTQLRRPDKDDPSCRITTRYQFCPDCVASFAGRYFDKLSPEEVLWESAPWEHPSGSEEVVRANREDVEEARQEVESFDAKFARAEQRIKQGSARHTSGRIV